MLDGKFVFNAVSHAYNLTDENTETHRYSVFTRETLCEMHTRWQSGIGMSREDQCTDWPMEVVARALFLESDCDMAATHTLRLDSLWKDGLCRKEKTLEAVRRWPQRFVGYVGVDPILGLETCLRELEEQVEEMPNAVGLKLYPAQVNPFRSWRMDDPELAYPLFGRAQELGIKVIAVHKAAPFGPVPSNPYQVTDVEASADMFPDLSFEIVHAGLAFVEETQMMLGRFPNVYANLEGTSSFINAMPGVFEQFFSQFMAFGGPSKIIYSDGNMVLHSQPILDAFRTFKFSEKTLNDLGIEQITEEDKALILGGNFARITGVDIEEAKLRIANDEFAQERAETGIQAAYSNWRKHLAAERKVYV